MMRKNIEKAVIIGAGPAGLCVGWNLVASGKEALLLEKTDTIGGLAISFRDGDYLFDLGPHNFHTVHSDILRFVKEILKDDLRQYFPTVKIFFRGKFMRYPLKGINAFTALSLKVMPLAILSFLFARLKLFLRAPKEDDSFESWLRNRFGPVLYKIYFHSYAQKVWMLSPSEISKYVAEKRVPVMRISDYLRDLLYKPVKKHHSEDVGFIESYYPKKGIGQVTTWLYNKITEGKGKFELNSEIVAINGKDKKIESITYCQDGRLKSIETDMLFSTMPLNELIKALKMDVPDTVREAAEKLDYVSEVLFFLKVNKREVFDSSLVYFSDPKIKFNRIYNVGAFSEDCVPAGKAAFCIEFTCNKGDDIWNADTDTLYNHIMDVLGKNQLILPSEVDGYFMKRITHAYPRFRIGFERNVKIILDYISTIENIIVLGRQGLFCYANVDDALHMGFKACEALNSCQIQGINYSELFPQHIYF